MQFDIPRDTREAAAFLTERGFRIAPATLNKLRCLGGGPHFEVFGRRPLYREKALLEWVRARTTPPLHSTSDPAANRSRSLAAPIEASKPEFPQLHRVRRRKTFTDGSKK
jgi:hypothetical protein